MSYIDISRERWSPIKANHIHTHGEKCIKATPTFSFKVFTFRITTRGGHTSFGKSSATLSIGHIRYLMSVITAFSNPISKMRSRINLQDIHELDDPRTILG